MAHKELVHEREEKSTLKGEQAIMRKKFSTFQSEMAKLKNVRRRFSNERASSRKHAAVAVTSSGFGVRAAEIGGAGEHNSDFAS